MAWFKAKPDPEIRGWRIQVMHNAGLDQIRYRVFRNPIYSPHLGVIRKEEFKWFADYDEALQYYHEQAGWRLEREEQP